MGRDRNITPEKHMRCLSHSPPPNEGVEWEMWGCAGTGRDGNSRLLARNVCTFFPVTSPISREYDEPVCVVASAHHIDPVLSEERTLNDRDTVHVVCVWVTHTHADADLSHQSPFKCTHWRPFTDSAICFSTIGKLDNSMTVVKEKQFSEITLGLEGSIEFQNM